MKSSYSPSGSDRSPVTKRPPKMRSSPSVGEVRVDIGYIARTLNLPVHEIAEHLRSPLSPMSAASEGKSPIYAGDWQQRQDSATAWSPTGEPTGDNCQYYTEQERSITSPFVLPKSTTYEEASKRPMAGEYPSATAKGIAPNFGLLFGSSQTRPEASVHHEVRTSSERHTVGNGSASLPPSVPPTALRRGQSVLSQQSVSSPDSLPPLPSTQRPSDTIKTSLLDALLGPVQQKHFKVRTVATISEGNATSPLQSPRRRQTAVALPLQWGEDIEPQVARSSQVTHPREDSRSSSVWGSRGNPALGQSTSVAGPPTTPHDPAEYDVTNPESIYYNPYADPHAQPTAFPKESDLSSHNNESVTATTTLRGAMSSSYLPSSSDARPQAVIREASPTEAKQMLTDKAKNMYGSSRRGGGGEAFNSSSRESKRSHGGQHDHSTVEGATFLSLEQGLDGTVIAGLKRVIVSPFDEVDEDEESTSEVDGTKAAERVKAPLLSSSRGPQHSQVNIMPDDTVPPPPNQVKSILSKVKRRVKSRVQLGDEQQATTEDGQDADYEEARTKSVHFSEDTLIASLNVIQTSRSTVVMHVEYRRPKIAYAGALVAVALQGLGWTMVAASSYSSHHPTTTVERSHSVSLTLFFAFAGAAVLSTVMAIAQGSPNKLESLSLRHPHHLKKLCLCVVSGALSLISFGVAFMFSIASVNIVIYAVLPLILSLGVATVIDKKLSVFDAFGLVMALAGTVVLIYGEVERPSEATEDNAVVDGDHLGVSVRYISAALSALAAIFQVARVYCQAQCRRYFSPLVVLAPTSAVAAIGMLVFCIADGSFTRTQARDLSTLGEISSSTARLMLAASIALFSSIWLSQMTSKFFDNVTSTGLLSLSGVIAMLLYAAYDLPVIGSGYQAAAAFLVSLGSIILVIAGYLNRRFVELVIDLPFLGAVPEVVVDDSVTPQHTNRRGNSLPSKAISPNVYFAGYKSALGNSESSPTSPRTSGAASEGTDAQAAEAADTADGSKPAYTPAHFDAFLQKMKAQKEKQRQEREAALALARRESSVPDPSAANSSDTIHAGQDDAAAGIQ